ncbi:MAG: rhodanese-like domain-containing protein [Planctomycetota bacterium]|jgi:rhodanese-related sulfurtransferase
MVQAVSSSQLIDVAPRRLQEWLAAGEAVIVDVREDFEHASERIEGSHPHPFSDLDPEEIRQLHGDKRIVFQCRTGRRSRDAAIRFGRDATEPVFHLAGGIEAWKGAGLGTTRSSTAPRIDVMRQVQMTAGGLVLVGVLLGVFVSPWFLILSGFVGAGLLFAGASGWCGMAMLLGRMPWNRVSIR